MRQIAVVKNDFPAWDVVPTTIIDFIVAISSFFQIQAEFLGANNRGTGRDGGAERDQGAEGDGGTQGEELIHHAQCPMPNAQCPIPNTPCPMPNITNFSQMVMVKTS
ncbi:MAG: hypothetical protein V7K36_06560 [Nostoc sp.]